jgi:SAM-dependent methyltransferase
VRTSPRLTKSSLDDFYRNHYRELYVGTTQVTEDVWNAKVRAGEEVRRYLLEAGYSDFERVADIACGTGGLLVAFRSAGSTVVGCDLGSNFLEYGIAHGLDLRVGEAQSLSEDGPFDLVILSHMLEHMIDPIQFLREEVLPLLHEDGCVYIEVPGLLSVANSYGDPLNYFQNAHLWGFTINTLDRIAERAGLERVSGTEYIRSVYRVAAKSPLTRPSRRVNSSDAAQVIASLVSAERGIWRGRVVRALRRVANFFRKSGTK